MSIDRRRELHASRRHRSGRSSSLEQSGIRNEPIQHDSESSHAPNTPHRTLQGPISHQKDEVQSTKRERRRSQRKRSCSNLPSPPIETPITSVLGDLRDDIEETNFSPQHSSTVYGDAGAGDTRTRGWPLGPVYVENRSGFSQISRERAFDGSDGRNAPFWGYWQQSERTAAPTENKPVHLAINIQSCWTPFATFCHGVLAGVSLMQTIFVEVIATSTSDNVAEFTAIYGKLSQLFSSLMYILLSLCVISVFDRMDISHTDCRQFLVLLSSRPRISWLLVPLYGVTLILTFLAARTDEWLAIRNTEYVSWTGNVSESSTEKTDLQMFEIWRIYNILRCACVLLGWLILATACPKDRLLLHLKAMLRPLAPVPVRIS